MGVCTAAAGVGRVEVREGRAFDRVEVEEADSG